MKLLHTLALGTALCASFLASAAPATLMPESTAPPIVVSGWVKGTPVTQFKKGQIYVVEFWATWCGPCKESIPHLTALAKEYPKVTFVGVSAFENDQADVAPFVKQEGDQMVYHVAMDKQTSPTARNSGIMAKTYMDAANQPGIPTAFLIDGNGKIAWIGHPMNLADPLKQLVAGTWNEDKAKADFEKAQADAAAEEAKQASDPLNLAVQQFGKDMDAKKFTAAVKDCDAVATACATDKRPDISDYLRYVAYMGGKDYKNADASMEKCLSGVYGKIPGFLVQMSMEQVGPKSTIPQADKDFDLAMKLANQAITLTNKKDATAYDALAWCYFTKGDKSNAVANEKLALAVATDAQKATLEANLATFQK